MKAEHKSAIPIVIALLSRVAPGIPRTHRAAVVRNPWSPPAVTACSIASRLTDTSSTHPPVATLDSAGWLQLRYQGVSDKICPGFRGILAHQTDAPGLACELAQPATEFDILTV